MIKRVYGRDGKHSTCYLTRVKLTPMTRWGQLYFHFFHRGDLDRDFHDHPYDFWTFPLKTYYEDVLDLPTGLTTRKAVKSFRWHFRPAKYAHRQLGAIRSSGKHYGPYSAFARLWPQNALGGRTATFVWRKRTRRPWGFWKVTATRVSGYRQYHWVFWKEYLFT